MTTATDKYRQAKIAVDEANRAVEAAFRSCNRNEIDRACKAAINARKALASIEAKMSEGVNA